MPFDQNLPPTGVGLGLRWSFLREVLEGAADGRLRFLEIAPENYIHRGDWIGEAIEQAADRLPILSHGLSLSLGGTDPLDDHLLSDIRDLLGRVHAPWHSDHLCFTSSEGVHLHELLPIPWSVAMARHVADRVRRAQDRLGVRIAVENITYYPQVDRAASREADFIRSVLEMADCGLLLDLNNVHVNAHNHGFDPWDWLRNIPLERVVQIHVAGPETWEGNLLVDTHATVVPERVKEMLSWTLARTGPLPVLLERDHAIPQLSELLCEVDSLQALYDEAIARRGCHAA
jgi:uncharacterized protein (UPF0276 family)